MQYIYYPRCSTCIKGLKYLQEHNYEVTLRDITVETPTYEELLLWIDLYGEGIKPFFNTSGKLYREMNMKDKIKTLSKEEAALLLSENGMLIKRPLLINEEKIFIGFKGVYDL